MIMVIMEKLVQELNRDKRISFEKANGVVDAIKSFKNAGGDLADLKFDIESYQVLILIFIDMMKKPNFSLDVITLEEIISKYCKIIKIENSSFDTAKFYTNLQGLKNQVGVQRRKIPTKKLQTVLFDTRKYSKFSQ
jgi:hypothetical protein